MTLSGYERRIYQSYEDAMDREAGCDPADHAECAACGNPILEEETVYGNDGFSRCAVCTIDEALDAIKTDWSIRSPSEKSSILQSIESAIEALKS